MNGDSYFGFLNLYYVKSKQMLCFSVGYVRLLAALKYVVVVSLLRRNKVGSIQFHLKRTSQSQ